ncbi:translation initiation factor IF-2-like [Lemur catta]|uniref:translation initiation factor IF-2-like n=1 Tax=Lemur catta TaxID=9447 RepID=UPI001E26AD87|nr:translation initiation factor IF-2-like [Lemur catta]
MPPFSGQLRSHLSPLLPPRRRQPLQSPPGRSARRQRGASVAFPSPPPGPPPPASPELSVAQTSPPGPARPSPHAPQTLSNPLGSRRLLRGETLAAAGAGAARLRAGRRRGARYGEPSNEARAGAQRRRVLAEHGRGAAAAVAAGAQGPLHHWQPWNPSIFLPQGRRLGSTHVLGEEGAGARASPEGGGPGSTSPRCSRGRAGGGRRRRRRLLSWRRWWPDGLVQRLQPTPFKGTRATASRVSIPRSPLPPRHESGFLPQRVMEPSSPCRTWARPRPAPPSPPRGMPQRRELRVPPKAGALGDRWCLLCSAVVAAMWSSPFDGQAEAAGQMLQLFAVNCLNSSQRGSSLKRDRCNLSFPGGKQASSVNQLTPTGGVHSPAAMPFSFNCPGCSPHKI